MLYLFVNDIGATVGEKRIGKFFKIYKPLTSYVSRGKFRCIFIFNFSNTFDVVWFGVRSSFRNIKDTRNQAYDTHSTAPYITRELTWNEAVDDKLPLY